MADNSLTRRSQTSLVTPPSGSSNISVNASTEGNFPRITISNEREAAVAFQTLTAIRAPATAQLLGPNWERAWLYGNEMVGVHRMLERALIEARAQGIAVPASHIFKPDGSISPSPIMNFPDSAVSLPGAQPRAQAFAAAWKNFTEGGQAPLGLSTDQAASNILTNTRQALLPVSTKAPSAPKTILAEVLPAEATAGSNAKRVVSKDGK